LRRNSVGRLTLRRCASGGIVGLHEFSELVMDISWLTLATVLVLDLTGVLRRGTGFRLQLTGLLIMNTVRDPLLLGRWDSGGDWAFIWAALFAGLALLVRGSVIALRERHPAGG
jgi:hypothetical protein